MEYFQQTDFYARWQKRFGRDVRFVDYNNKKYLFVKHNLPHIGYVWTCPRGDISDAEFLKKEFKDAVFVQVNNDSFKKAVHSSFTQPFTERVVDLSNISFSYSVRRTDPTAVEHRVISENFMEHFDDFYSLLHKTSSRGSFSLHSKEYYIALFEELENADLIFTMLNGNLVVVTLVKYTGDTAYYLFGASAQEGHKVSAPLLAQVHAINLAKERGYKYYNLGGLVGNLDIFKSKFGGSIVEYTDSDLVLSPIKYFIFRTLKALKIHKLIGSVK